MRAPLLRCLGLGLSIAALPGCFGPASPSQRLADSAYEMNDAMRFARMDLALSHVAPAARDSFVRRHQAWGSAVRIVDVEFGGVGMSAKDQAEVLLAVSWQKPDEAVIRVTQVAQRWRDVDGWKVVSEDRRGGAWGLFGEPEPKTPPPAEAAPAEPSRQAAQLKTRVIYEE